MRHCYESNFWAQTARFLLVQRQLTVCNDITFISHLHIRSIPLTALRSADKTT